MKRIVCLWLVGALCGCARAGLRDSTGTTLVAPQPVAAGVPVTDRKHGVPEGTLVTIRGRYVTDAEKHDYYSANMTQNLFAVTSIDGKSFSLRAELVDPPALLGEQSDHNDELTLVGYFYRAVAAGSLVEGFDPPGTQGHEFSYALKFRVKRPSK